MAKKPAFLPDEFCDDGKTLKLNRSRPYGVVYSAMLDEWKGKPMPAEETKFVQNGVNFKGDGIPVDYIPAAQRGVPVVEPAVEEVLAENEQLKRQVAAQDQRLKKLEEMLLTLTKASERKKPGPKPKIPQAVAA